jgi:hypothetical protein
MVNRENVLKVAEAIENHSIKWLGFNMSFIGTTADEDHPDRLNSCQTIACIAGWTKAVLEPVGSSAEFLHWTERHFTHDVADLLGLDGYESAELFLPDRVEWDTITPAQAVRVLRHLAETGEVDWSVADKPLSPESAEGA